MSPPVRNLKTVHRGKLAMLTAFIASLLLLTAFGGSNPRAFVPDAARFVEIDSKYFVVVPNISQFIEKALPQIAAIEDVKRSVFNRAKTDKTDIASGGDLLTIAFAKLPAACRFIQTVDDLEPNGLAPGASAMYAVTDGGWRGAFKYTDPVRGAGLLTDVLSPLEVEVTLPELQEPETPPDDAGNTDDPASAPAAPTAEPVPKLADLEFFEIAVQGTGVGLCPNIPGRRRMGPGEIFKLPIQSVTDNIGNKEILPQKIPVFLDPTETTPALNVGCQVVRADGSRTPCACTLTHVPRGPGGSSDDIPEEEESSDAAETDTNGVVGPPKNTKLAHFKSQTCGATVDLTARAQSVRDVASTAVAGDPVKLGGYHVRAVDSFYLVGEQGGEIEDPKKALPVPAASIMGDDSLVDHFERMLSDRDSRTTIVGAFRPDELSERSFVPAYLLTPIAIHFTEREIDIEAAINPEPADAVQLQALVKRSIYQDTQQSVVGDALAVGGSMIADPDLRTYLATLELVSPGFVEGLRNVGPFSPFVLSFLSNYTKQAEVSFIGVDPAINLWHLAMVVPNVTINEAKEIIEKERLREANYRQSTVLQNAAKLLLDRIDAGLAKETDADSNISAWSCKSESSCEEEGLGKRLSELGVVVDEDTTKFKIDRARREVSAEFSIPELPEADRAGNAVLIGPKPDLKSILWTQDLANRDHSKMLATIKGLGWGLRRVCTALVRAANPPPVKPDDTPPDVAEAPPPSNATPAPVTKTPDEIYQESLIAWKRQQRSLAATKCGQSLGPIDETLEPDTTELNSELESIRERLALVRARRLNFSRETLPEVPTWEEMAANAEPYVAKFNTLVSRIAVWRKILPPLNEAEIARVCDGDPRFDALQKPDARGAATYDAATSKLYLAHTVADLNAVLNYVGSGVLDPEPASDPGKLRLFLTTQRLGQINWTYPVSTCLCGVPLGSGGCLGGNPDDPAIKERREFLIKFPFPRVTLDLYGQERVMTWRLRLRKAPGAS